MRTVTFGGATSLDNFLARPDGGVDWLRWNDGAAEIMKTFWSSIDTVLMGRKTYEAAARMNPATGRSKRKSKPADLRCPALSATCAGCQLSPCY